MNIYKVSTLGSQSLYAWSWRWLSRNVIASFTLILIEDKGLLHAFPCLDEITDFGPHLYVLIIKLRFFVKMTFILLLRVFFKFISKRSSCLCKRMPENWQFEIVLKRVARWKKLIIKLYYRINWNVRKGRFGVHSFRSWGMIQVILESRWHLRRFDCFSSKSNVYEFNKHNLKSSPPRLPPSSYWKYTIAKHVGTYDQFKRTLGVKFKA